MNLLAALFHTDVTVHSAAQSSNCGIRRGNFPVSLSHQLTIKGFFSPLLLVVKRNSLSCDATGCKVCVSGQIAVAMATRRQANIAEFKEML